MGPPGGGLIKWYSKKYETRWLDYSNDSAFASKSFSIVMLICLGFVFCISLAILIASILVIPFALRSHRSSSRPQTTEILESMHFLRRTLSLEIHVNPCLFAIRKQRLSWKDVCPLIASAENKSSISGSKGISPRLSNSSIECMESTSSTTGVATNIGPIWEEINLNNCGSPCIKSIKTQASIIMSWWSFKPIPPTLQFFQSFFQM